MSRSEHGRARDRDDPRDRARKYAIKTRIVAERRHLDTDVPPVSADAIPIVIVDRGPSIHHPASADDLRGVMARLPEGSLNGVARIELALTAGPDTELLPGVRAPSTLGDYTTSNAAIRLYAYVYDPAVPDRERLELYLRVLMLVTLAHELGHHQDFMARETRGRWQPDPRDAEPAAVAIEDRWAASYVVPYIEDTYADAVAAMQGWLVATIGTPLPLDILARPSTHLFGARDAFEVLLARAPTIQRRLLAAFYLHYDGHFELALAVIDHVLAEAPDDVEALGDRAHVLEHLAQRDPRLRSRVEVTPGKLRASDQISQSAPRLESSPRLSGIVGT